ncbi:MAG: hypothetical protein KC649_07675, partial [Candidatus Omnitrophica bacterium]|nr:hypothetical protein [Candidatus Omnitrophota bacterium]
RSDFKDIIRSESERILPFVASENNHLYPYRIFKQSQEKFLNWVDFRYDFIENELSALNVQFRFEKNALKLTVDGQSAFLPKIIVFDSTPGISKAVLDINQNGIEDESDIQVDFDITGNNLNVKTELRLLPGKKDIPKPYPSPGLHENSLEPAPKSYYLLFKSSGEQLSGRIRSVEGFNGITGEKIQASIAS